MKLTKFKKYIISLAALLIASATFVACSSSDDNIIDEPQQPATTGTYTMTINASKGDGATTRALELSGKTLSATWATTENVYVQKGSTWATGSLKPQTDGTTATLKGTLSDITIAAGDALTLQFPRSGARDYTGQVGTLADIAANYDYATATVKVASISSAGNINPEAATTMFTNQQAIVNFTLKDKATDAALSAMQLVVSDGTNSYTVTPASAASEIYVALPGFSGKTVSLTANVAGKLYTYSKNPVTFTNGQYYEITVKMSTVGALVGKFTINASGDKVHFSQGNLQATYNGSAWSWAFATNQWDYIGNAIANNRINGNGTVSANGTVDFFGWVGASSTWTGAAQYGISNSSATNNTNGYGNVASEALKSDWGNTIGSGWRTLTTDEWTYLFNTRSASTVNNTKNARYAKAYLFGTKHGVILFPDSYTHPDGVAAPTGINATNNTSWDANKYSAADWAKMEAAGCVFLPAAAYRSGSWAYDVGTNGNYWSSSPHATNVSCAYRVYFSSGSLDLASDTYRYYGFSVRLVRNAN